MPIIRRILPITVAALTLSAGVAFADHGRGRGHRGYYRPHTSSTVVVRSPYYQSAPRHYYRSSPRHVYVARRPVYLTRGRFVFGGGFYRTYRAPIIHARYYDYRYRPALIIENYDPVPGYLWVQGHWRWGGYEWVWTPGYYAPDQAYNGGYYGSGYDSSGYDGGGSYDGSDYGGHVHDRDCGHGYSSDVGYDTPYYDDTTY